MSSAATAISVHCDPRDATDPSLPRLDREIWNAAFTLDAFIEQAVKLKELWISTRRIAHITDEQRARALAVGGPLSLLVLLEDWCGDAIHTIPTVLRLCEANPALTLRVIKRDEHPALMHSHRTHEARAIPVLIAYDVNDHERGWWGPRPSPLEAWVQSDGMQMDKVERYKAIRTWYARDRAATTVQEVLTVLEHADRR